MMQEMLHTRNKAMIREHEAEQACMHLPFMGLLELDRGRLKLEDEVHVDTTNGCSLYMHSLKASPAVNGQEFAQQRRASVVSADEVNGLSTDAAKEVVVYEAQF